LTTRIGISNHFCKENNITDLTNKYIAQSNLAFIIGNLTGLFISINLPQPYSFPLIFSVVMGFTLLHILSGYKSVEQVSLNTLNFQRAYLLGNEILETHKIISPEMILKKESLFFKNDGHIKFCNFPMEYLLKSEKNIKLANNLFDMFKEYPFFCFVKIKKHYTPKKLFRRRNKSEKMYRIYTYMKLEAENGDILLAFLFTLQLSKFLELLTKASKTDITEDKIIELIQNTQEQINKINKTQMLHDLRTQGWNTNFHSLETEYMRYHLLIK
jgi:hypothetical protein